MGRIESPLCSRGKNRYRSSVRGKVHHLQGIVHMQGPVGFIPVPVIDAVGDVRGFLNFRKNNVLTDGMHPSSGDIKHISGCGADAAQHFAYQS